MGILEWNLNLMPNTKQEIYYQFTVEYPPEFVMNSQLYSESK